MNAITRIMNSVRRMESMFPGYFATAKHNHYSDFGWPETVDFNLLFQTYERNGLAKSGVNKTILKTWEDFPNIWETEKPAESTIESQIRQRFEDIRFFARLSEVDRRSMVGGYAGAILRLADGKRFNQPVDRVPGGLAGLVEIIPAWAGQLTVSTWDTDETSPTYGQPTMFAFHESAVGTENEHLKARQFELHPDRVLIWSMDGTVHCPSDLKSGINDLITMEKVSGAGGEGFWKNAKSGIALELSPDTKLDDMAKGMNVPIEELADAMNETVGDFNKGFDKLLMLQGMQAKTLGVTLPSPEHFFNIALQSFAASMNIPLKILVGNQTGERASTEDQAEWAKTNMARRNLICRPTIKDLLNRLERFGILPERDWVVGWTDLTEASISERIERADKMASINQKNGQFEPVYTNDEIRDVTGHEPFSGEGNGE